MRLYLIPVMGVCFVVDVLLLLSAKGLVGDFRIRLPLLLGAALDAVYAGLCLMPSGVRLDSAWWRIVSLALVSVISFGVRWEGLRGALIFASMSLATWSLPAELGSLRGGGVAAGIALLLCMLVLLGKGKATNTARVRLHHNGMDANVIALRDTGNCLRDPIFGDPVLIVGPELAESFLGLKRMQLADPVGTLTQNAGKGLRIIPYHTVGGRGFLLACRLDGVWVEGRRTNSLVAFAADGLEAGGKYQALTGGSL